MMHDIPSHFFSPHRNGLGCDIMSQINEITDGLYLCGARAMKGQRLLDMGITNVVNVTVELPCLNIDQVSPTAEFKSLNKKKK
jgi:hypothetical protein